MRALAKSALCLAATALAFPALSHAQLVTYETVSKETGSVYTLNPETTLTQTFTNVWTVDTLVYRFTYSSTGGDAIDFTAYFGEWNTSTNTLDSVLGSWTLSVPATSSFQAYSNVVNNHTYNYNGYDAGLSLASFSLDPSKTYGILLANETGNPTNTGLQAIVAANPFTYGYGVATTDFGGGFSNTTTFPDWGFYQITVTPAPEASTTAAIIGITFVAGLVGFRIRQRRRAGELTELPMQAA